MSWWSVSVGVDKGSDRRCGREGVRCSLVRRMTEIRRDNPPRRSTADLLPSLVGQSRHPNILEGRDQARQPAPSTPRGLQKVGGGTEIRRDTPHRQSPVVCGA